MEKENTVQTLASKNTIERKLISRADAFSIGLKNYFTGIPCKHGHVEYRNVSDNKCCECKRISVRKSYSKHKEKRIKYVKKWQSENKIKTMNYKEKYRRENKEKAKEASKNCRLKNIEKYKRKSAEYQRKNKGKTNAKTMRRIAAKRLATPKWFEKSQVDIVYEKASEFGFDVDHIVPLQSDIVCGLHCLDNLQLLHPSINRGKGNRDWPDMPDN